MKAGLGAMLSVILLISLFVALRANGVLMPSMPDGWWCWSGDALPDPHPSPYVLSSGMDHPCTQAEFDAWKKE